MPIRTNRGRAAVYRRLWGWPLRSPRHLMLAGIGVVVVAVAIAIAVGQASASRHNANGGSGGAGSTVITNEVPTGSVQPTLGTDTPTTTTAAGGTRLSAPPETPTSAPPAPAALAVINAWGKAWVNHPVGMTNAQWLAQLKPYTTSEFLPEMGSVDVSNIDATQITGQPSATKSYTSSVEALLPTNAGKLDITAIATPTGWLVSSYTEAS